ncbi:DUF3761 domain-containing protein [Streptomyces hilarionis]|nr:DUF3761 domain-containing protein [Streptomyces hilarionis]MCQ9129234.1 DUF3761 domain-containing protein [Streptomyces hilarionis]
MQGELPCLSGATATCKYGSNSYSSHFRGTCPHHRGVTYWYR